MAGISSLADLGTGAVEYAVGFGLGVALGRALGPLAVSLEQEAFSVDPSKALDPQDAARIVAQTLQDLGWGSGEAAQTGINSDRFALLHELEVRAPAVGELLDMVRRSTVSDADFAHGLRKAQLDSRYDAAVKQLAQRPLEGAELANAIHRGNMDGGDLLPFPAPRTLGRIPQYPISPLDPLQQAQWSGMSHDQLGVLVANAGLPLAIGEMLALLNRGEVTEDDVRRAVAHSNLRNEYMEAALLLRRRLLTPREYAEAELRGILTRTDAAAGAGLSGLEEPDYVTLFETVGRPLPVHQIVTGEARGGTYGGTYDDVPEPFRDAIRRSNIRPEYAVLAHANRYNYPSAFVLRSLVQGGELTVDEGHQALLDIGWPPDLAKKVATAWGGGTTGSADKHVAKAETQLWGTLHRSYVSQLTTDTEATSDLATLGVDQAAIPQVLSLWKMERAITRRTLTPAQLKKAVADKLMTSGDATNRLLELGYDQADATTLLSE